MLRTNTLIVFLILMLNCPAFSQNDFSTTSSTATPGDLFGSTTPAQPESSGYTNQSATSGGNVNLAPQGTSAGTTTQVGNSNGPNLLGTPSSASGAAGSSGTVTSAPYSGSYTASGNFALHAVGQSTLPPTVLDSFVANSGYDDTIYGDESMIFLNLPPYFDFSTINSGINSPGLTTGHPSDAPSAWGDPN